MGTELCSFLQLNFFREFIIQGAKSEFGVKSLGIWG